MSFRSAQQGIITAAILILCPLFTSISSAAQNLVINPGFESGNTTGWYAFGGCNVSVSGTVKYNGSYSGYVTDRTAGWQGLCQELTLTLGKNYRISAWMRLQNNTTASARVIATIKQTFSNHDPEYINFTWATGSTTGWTKLEDVYTHFVEAGRILTKVELYFQTEDGTTYNYYLDDVSVIDTAPPQINRITITGPQEVYENSGNIQYLCTVYHSDGTSQDVTNSTFWSVDSYANITNSGNRGLLTPNPINSNQICTITAIYQGFSDTHEVNIIEVPIEIIGIEIWGADRVRENSGEQFHCNAKHNYDHIATEITGSVSWSVQPDTYASISDNGLLTTLPMASNQQCTVTANYNGLISNFTVTLIEESQPFTWRELAKDRIEQHRKRDAEITVVDNSGSPIYGVNAEIRQKKHSFAFGSAINNKYVNGTRNMSNSDYKNFFVNHFEWAVCEDESKWYSNEPAQNYVTYTDADIIYNWCRTNGIPMRGHCLFWEVESVQKNYQTWVWNLDYATLPASSPLRTAVQNRLNSAMNHFKGKFLHWDIDNEILSGSFYRDRLGESIIPWMFRTAAKIDPACKLFVNEYAGNSFGWYDGWSYADIVDDLRNSGTPVHGVGLQGHVSANFDPQQYFNYVLEPLTQTGLPMWITEFDTDNVSEKGRANDLENFYRLVFSHPAVEGILMWGFWQSSHWRENWWIVNSDWTLNEAGVRYEALMREWTTNTDETTGADGILAFRGFHGTYEITLSTPGADAEVKTIELPPGDTTRQFTLTMNIESNQPQNCADIAAQGLSLDSDLNHDCYVDYDDLKIIAEQWLADDCGASDNCLGADFVPDGSVNFNDLSNFAIQWMQCNDPEAPGCVPIE